MWKAVERAERAWEVPENFQHARTIQEEIRNRLRIEPFPTGWRYVLGVDCAFPRRTGLCVAGAVLWDKQNQRTLEQAVSITPIRSPYVPGFLSFREIPALLEALKGIHGKVDVILVDGQGVCHPRWCGLATHLGILLDMPTIGIAKSHLYGLYTRPGDYRGAWVPVWDEKYPVIIGALLRTRNNVKPIYVSIGNRIRLHDAIQTVLECAPRYRLPEPQRLADALVRSFSRWLRKS